MDRRGAGVAFIFLAGLLYAARYVAAAIYASGSVSWSRELFSAMYQNVGPGLTVASSIALAVGVMYLVYAEFARFHGFMGHFRDGNDRVQ